MPSRGFSRERRAALPAVSTRSPLVTLYPTTPYPATWHPSLYAPPVVSHIGAPYDHRRERRLAVPDRTPGHGQARSGRARDRARPRRQRGGPLGERRGRDRRDPAPRDAQAAHPGGPPERGPDRARDRDAGRGTHAARRADAAAAHHRIDRPRG